MSFMERTAFLSPNQYGFRPKLSTEDAIQRLTSTLYSSLDRGEKLIAVFLDLAKAFDTVDHSVLLAKMYSMGIRGIALQLFKNYLEGRPQRVKISNRFISKDTIVDCGVPQGTVLGPTLFLIYINQLCNLSIDGNIITYADDTALILSGPNWEDTFTKTNSALKSVYKWLNKNYLTLNESKTVYMTLIIDSRTQPAEYHCLKLHSDLCTSAACNCPLISKVKHVKYLGVEIDENLKWNKQIEQLLVKTRFLMFNFYNLRNIVNKTLIITIYKAMAQAILQYGIIGWGGCSKNNISKILVAQKRMLKVALRRKTSYSSDLVFQEANVLDVRQIYLKTLLTYILKNRKQFKIKPNTAGYSLRNENVAIYELPLKNTSLGQRHADFLAPKFYNNLPQQITSIINLKKQKEYLKNWLFENGRQYYDIITKKQI
jgi:hypothetical protein